MLVESSLACVIAPIMMAFHATFAVTTVLGRRVQWNCQARDEQGQSVGGAIANHGRQMLAGFGTTILVWNFTPEMLFWLAPVWVGLMFSIPLSLILSSVALGRLFAAHGILVTPEETNVPAILQRQRELLAAADSPIDTAGLFERFVVDPALLALHCSILHSGRGIVAVPERRLRWAISRWISSGADGIPKDLRRQLLSDPKALRAMHVSAWTSGRCESAAYISASLATSAA